MSFYHFFKNKNGSKVSNDLNIFKKWHEMKFSREIIEFLLSAVSLLTKKKMPDDGFYWFLSPNKIFYNYYNHWKFNYLMINNHLNNEKILLNLHVVILCA